MNRARQRARGAALIEGIILVPIFLTFWIGLVYLQDRYTRALDSGQRARYFAFEVREPSSGGGQREKANNPCGGSMFNPGPQPGGPWGTSEAAKVTYTLEYTSIDPSAYAYPGGAAWPTQDPADFPIEPTSTVALAAGSLTTTGKFGSAAKVGPFEIPESSTSLSVLCNRPSLQGMGGVVQFDDWLPIYQYIRLYEEHQTPAQVFQAVAK